MHKALIDSSCWLEYFKDSLVGREVAPVIKEISTVIVPTIVLYEVFKKMLIEKDEDTAIFAAAQLKQGIVIDLNQEISLLSAKTSTELKLPMADSIIYTVAKKYNAVLYTQDKHFAKLKNVRYYGKPEA